MSWWNKKDKLMDQVQEDLWNLEEKRWERKGVPFASSSGDSTPIHRDITELKRIVRTIQKNGMSMWNYKQVLPRIFDVISGAFGVLEDLADKASATNERLKTMEKNNVELGRSIEFLVKKVDSVERGIDQAFDRMDDNKLDKVKSKK